MSQSPKHEFIEKFILPLFDPAIEYFGQYGVDEMTVITVPVLVLLLIAIKMEYKKKRKVDLILYIIAVILILIIILKYQFFE